MTISVVASTERQEGQALASPDRRSGQECTTSRPQKLRQVRQQANAGPDVSGRAPVDCVGQVVRLGPPRMGLP